MRLMRYFGSFICAASLAACTSVDLTREPSPINGRATQLIAVGDIAYCKRAVPHQTAAHQTALLASALLADDPAARVLTLGDNVYEIGAASEFADCYEPTWGRLRSRTWPTPGNHDYGVEDAHGYFDYFGLNAGVERKGYYLQKLNGWAVISLNSNIDASVTSAQYQWLEGILKELNRPGSHEPDSGKKELGQLCVLAAWHHPVFTSAPRGDQIMMQAIFDLLVRHRADLVLQGHEHHFERFAPMRADGKIDHKEGVRSMVVGTGGAPLSGYRAEKRVGSEQQIREFGVLALALTPGKTEWQFVNLERRVLDSGTIKCNSARIR
jgi:acid phosphatase type 7